MTVTCTAAEVVEMLRAEGLVDLPAGADGATDLFAAGMDSMAVMQLIVIIEERWGVRLGAEDATREVLGTPERLAARIRELA